MRLYVKTMIVVTLATLLLYAIVGLNRIADFERQRGEAALRLVSPALELAAERIGAAARPADELAALQRSFRVPLRLVRIDELPADAGDTGVYVESSQVFVYRRVDARTALLVGNVVDFKWSPAFMAAVLATPLVLGGLVASTLILPVARRIRALGRAIQQFAQGDLQARSRVTGADVVGGLSTNFNQMAAQIERLVASKRQLLEAVSHEFRTPIARIRFELEMLETAATGAERAGRVGCIDDSLVELDELVEEVLTYVRFDGRVPELPREHISAATVARGAIAASEALRRDVAVELVNDDGDDVVEVNPRYFRRALQNIVINAIRYAEARVRVIVRGDQEHVVVAIEDDGPGIPAEDRQRIFEPFSRLEASRSRDVGGVGLGLAIVQRICAWHGASVDVGTAELGGASFITRWPRARP